MVRQVELSKDAVESSTFLINQQQQISLLESELRHENDAFNELKRRYAIMSTEIGRQQALGRQQAAIEALEIREREFRKEIANITAENKRLVTSEGEIYDELCFMKSKHAVLKNAYESDILTLRSTTEGSLAVSQANAKEQKKLKVQLDNYMNRFNLIERGSSLVNEQKEESEKVIDDLKGDIRRLTDEIKRLKGDIQRKHTTSLVAIASRGQFQSDLFEAKKELEKCRKARTALQTTEDELRAEIVETEDYVDQLQSMIEDNDSHLLSMENAAKIKVAEVAAQDIIIKDLEFKLGAVVARGCTEEKQIEWDEREVVLRKAIEKSKKLQAHLSKCQTKIFDLENELETLQSGV